MQPAVFVSAGAVVDQAALHGVLRNGRDLALPLVLVMEVGPKQADGPDGNADTDCTHFKKKTHS